MTIDRSTLSVSLLGSEEMSKNIPREIFQTWKTRDVPEHWKESQISIVRHLDDWKYTLFTDEDNREFVKTYFPDFLSTYDAFPYNIQRADAIRYMYLYMNGGVYMDLDIVLQRSIDELLGNEDFYLVPSGNVGSTFTNSFMISKPKVAFWLEVIEEMKKPVSYLSLTKHFIVMNSTGPMMLTRVAKRYNKRFGYLPSTLVTPCNICDENCNTENAYMLPLNSGSWCSVDSKIFIFLLCNWKKLTFILISFFVAFILFLIGRNYKFI
jgi:mannosyltransferase OCH1-like enzyme